MLSLFRKKSEHPLASLKSAQQLLHDLSKTDSVKVLQEIGHWIETLFDPANEFQLDQQFAILRMFDDAAHPHLRKIIHSYFSVVPPTAFQEGRLWGAMNAYYSYTALGYLDLIIGLRNGEKAGPAIKANVSLISARGIYAVFGKLECAAVRYTQINPQLWKQLAEFYAYAETDQCLDEQLSLYAGLGSNTSVRRIFVGMQMWHSAVVGALRPQELHIAKRLICNMDRSFTVAEQLQEDSFFIFDLAKPDVPARVSEQRIFYPYTTRFASVGIPSGHFNRLLKTLDKGQVPENLNLGVAYSAEIVADVVRRFAVFCQTPKPVQRPPRRKTKMSVCVLNGFINMVEETCVDLNLNDPVSENWEVEDISANGLRFVLPESRAASVKIGSLVGLQPGRAMHWGVGVVRRLKRDGRNNLQVGVRILANKVAGIVLNEPGSSNDGYSALLLDSTDEQSGESLMLLKQDIFAANRSPIMKWDEQQYLMMPLAQVEKGVDFDLVRYRKMAQESAVGAEC